jgi:hypothetical protein
MTMKRYAGVLFAAVMMCLFAASKAQADGKYRTRTDKGFNSDGRWREKEKVSKSNPMDWKINQRNITEGGKQVELERVRPTKTVYDRYVGGARVEHQQKTYPKRTLKEARKQMKADDN